VSAIVLAVLTLLTAGDRLTEVAATFTGKPTAVRCAPVADWPVIVPGARALVSTDATGQTIFVRPLVCRDLHQPKPGAESIDAFTEGLVILRFAQLQTVPQIERAIRQSRRQVCRLLRIRCASWPKPEPRP
jgi:hypothetical protein